MGDLYYKCPAIRKAVDDYERLCTGRPQTNADRIRTMTDEELAIWILKHDTITEREGRKYGLDILDWLKAEVEG